jgi:hypothetical protein
MNFRHFGGPFIPAEAAADSRHFVSDDSFAISTTPQHDCTVRFSLRDRFGGWTDEVRIITGIGAVAAKIKNRMPQGFEELNNGLFQRKAGMVCANRNSERSFVHKDTMK